MASPRFLLILLLGLLGCSPRPEPIALPRPVPLWSVQMQGFWQKAIDRNYEQTLPHLWDRYAEHRYHFARAAGLRPGGYQGHRAGFSDAEVYKLLEAYAYHHALGYPWPAPLDTLIDWIAAAQQPDGHLQTRDALVADRLSLSNFDARHINRGGLHRLYNLGHLFEAASAAAQFRTDSQLLTVARRAAEPLLDHYVPLFAPRVVSGHPEIELGLLRLCATTGDVRYQQLARRFLAWRGQNGQPSNFDQQYSQQHQPLREQTQPVGHAVRALYLYRAMTLLGQQTGDRSWLTAADRLFEALVERHLYLHGGVGVHHYLPAPGRHFNGWEGFGQPYELPPDGYAETCAGVALALWAADLGRIHGQARYFELVERILYNHSLGAVSQSGQAFCYENNLCAPTATGRGDRRVPKPMSCCPFNLARLLPQVPGLLYSYSDTALWVHLGAASRAEVDLPGGTVAWRVQTDYPWQGELRLRFEAVPDQVLSLYLRVPSWGQGQASADALYQSAVLSGSDQGLRLTLNGEPLPSNLLPSGYLRLTRRWAKGDELRLQWPMAIYQVQAQPKVAALQGKVAVMRGPLLYAFEGLDQPSPMENLTIDPDWRWRAMVEADTLGGLTWLRAQDKAGRLQAQALPYFLRAHRDSTPMQVWLPLMERKLH